jgi:hypothetical protein
VEAVWSAIVGHSEVKRCFRFARHSAVIGGREAGSRSSKLDVQRVAVSHPTGYFHPKNLLLLVEDDEKNTVLIVAALSANLTRAGWWQNVEVAHIEEIKAGETCSFRDDLRALVRQVRLSAVHVETHPALDAIDAFIKHRMSTQLIRVPSSLRFLLFVPLASSGMRESKFQISREILVFCHDVNRYVQTVSAGASDPAVVQFAHLNSRGTRSVRLRRHTCQVCAPSVSTLSNLTFRDASQLLNWRLLLIKLSSLPQAIHTSLIVAAWV